MDILTAIEAVGLVFFPLGVKFGLHRLWVDHDVTLVKLSSLLMLCLVHAVVLAVRIFSGKLIDTGERSKMAIVPLSCMVVVFAHFWTDVAFDGPVALAAMLFCLRGYLTDVILASLSSSVSATAAWGPVKIFAVFAATTMAIYPSWALHVAILIGVAVCWDCIASRPTTDGTGFLISTGCALVLGAVHCLLGVKPRYSQAQFDFAAVPGALMVGLFAVPAFMPLIARPTPTARRPSSMVRAALACTVAACTLTCGAPIPWPVILLFVVLAAVFLLISAFDARPDRQLSAAPALITLAVVITVLTLATLIAPAPATTPRFTFTDPTPTPTQPVPYSATASEVDPVIVTWVGPDETHTARLLLSLFDTMAASSDIPKVIVITATDATEFTEKATALGDVTVVSCGNATLSAAVAAQLDFLSSCRSQVAVIAPRVLFRSFYSGLAYSAPGIHIHNILDVFVVATGKDHIAALAAALRGSRVQVDLGLARDLPGSIHCLGQHDVVDVTPAPTPTGDARGALPLPTVPRRSTLMLSGAPPAPMPRSLTMMPELSPSNMMSLMYMLLDERWATAEWMSTSRHPFSPADDAYVICVTDHTDAGRALTAILSLRLHTAARIIVLTDILTRDVMNSLAELDVEVVIHDGLPRAVHDSLPIPTKQDPRHFSRILALNINTHLKAAGQRPIKRMIVADVNMLALRSPDAMFEHPSPMAFTNTAINGDRINGGLVKVDLERLGAKLFDDLTSFARDETSCCLPPGQFWRSDVQLLTCYAIYNLKDASFVGSNFNDIGPFSPTHTGLLIRYNDTVIYRMDADVTTDEGRVYKTPAGRAPAVWDRYYSHVDCLTGRRVGCGEKAVVRRVIPGVCDRCLCPHRPRGGAVDIRTPAWSARHIGSTWWGDPQPLGRQVRDGRCGANIWGVELRSVLYAAVVASATCGIGLLLPVLSIVTGQSLLP